MGGAASKREIEIKLRVSSAAAGRRLLRNAGFRVVRRRVFESNVVYDWPAETLRHSRRLLRVRRSGRRALFTYKGPPDPGGHHKSRDEINVDVADASVLGKVLERLGLRPSFFYEKYRTEFAAPASSGLAMLDETPIGDFIELEGPPRWIDRMAGKMGFRQADYITASYARLYFEQTRGPLRLPARMIFDSEQD